MRDLVTLQVGQAGVGCSPAEAAQKKAAQERKRREQDQAFHKPEF